MTEPMQRTRVWPLAPTDVLVASGSRADVVVAADRWNGAFTPFVIATPERGEAVGTRTDAPTTNMVSNFSETTVLSEPKPSVRHVIEIPRPPEALRRFELLQQFEGTVRSVSDQEMVVELRDLTSPAMPPEEASFDLREVSDGDRSLLAVGAVFYWSIGYEVTAHGQKKRVSELRFRRWPPWTKREIGAIAADADDLYGFFGGGADEQSSRAG